MRRMRALGLADLFPGLQHALCTIEQLQEQISALEREIAEVSRQRYPHTELLRQVPGVGLITAFAYVLTLDAPVIGIEDLGQRKIVSIHVDGGAVE